MDKKSSKTKTHTVDATTGKTICGRKGPAAVKGQDPTCSSCSNSSGPGWWSEMQGGVASR